MANWKKVVLENSSPSLSGATFSGNLVINGSQFDYFRAVNSGNPEFHMGSSDTNKLHIQTVYTSSAQTLNYVTFTTKSSLGSTDAGKMEFYVDEAKKLTINDAGIDVAGTQVNIQTATSDRPILNIENQNADNAPPAIQLYKNSASPANSDQIGDVSWYAKDDGGTKTRLLLLRGFQTNVSASADSSKLSMYTTKNGVETATLTLEAGDATFGGSGTFGGQVKVTSSNASTVALSVGDTGTGWYNTGTNSIGLSINGANKLTVDSSGNILDGHTASMNSGGSTPKLQVSDNDNDASVGVYTYGSNAAHSASLRLAHSKSGTVGSHTVLADNDRIGTIEFNGSDGTNFDTIGARIWAEVDGTPASSRMPSALVFSTAAGGADDDITERMRIASDGRVYTADGISHLGDADTRMYMGDDDIQFLVGNAAMLRMLENGSQDEVVINEDQADVDFRVESDNNANAFFIQGSTGNIGINTNDPTFFLTAIGDATGDQATINQTHASYTGSALKIGAVRSSSSAYNLLYCATGTNAGGTGGTGQFVVRGDGNVGIGTSTPSHTLHLDATEPYIKLQGTHTDGLYLIGTGDGNLYFTDGSTGVPTMTIDDNLIGIGTASPTHKLHVLSTENKSFLLDRNQGNNPANLNEFSAYYSLSIKNRNSGSYLNFGGDANKTEIQATDGASTATAKNIVLNPYGGNVLIGKQSSAFGTAGTEIFSNGSMWVTKADGNPVGLNRTGGAGSVLEWYDDASIKGVLGTATSYFLNDVGIGTASPARPLHIDTSAHTYVRIESADTAKNSAIEFFDGTNYFYSGFMANESGVSAGEFALYTGSSVPAVVVKQNGNTTFSGDVSIKSTGGNNDPATLALWNPDTSISADDNIGVILAQGSDSGGSPPYLGGKIEFNADAVWDTGTTGYYPTRIDFFTESNSGTVSTASPRMTIDSSGNVGIGKTSGLSKTLHVDSTAGSAGTPNGIMMLNTVHGSNSKIYMYAENDSGAVKNSGITLDPDAETMSIDYNGNALTINSSGYIGIGTASPDVLLHLVSASSPAIRLEDTTNTVKSTLYSQDSNAHVGTTTNHSFIIDTNNTPAITIDTSQLSTFSGNIKINQGSASGNPRLTFAHDNIGTNHYIQMDRDADVMNIFVNGSNAIVIDSSQNATFSGKVGIGVTVPTHLLSVANSGSATDMSIGTYSSGKTAGVLYTSADTNGYFAIQSYKSQGSTYGNIVLNAQGGNVGIGTASPDSYNALAHNLVVYENSNSGITIASSTTGTGSLFFADGTTGDEAYKGRLEYNHGQNKLQLGANSVIHMTIDPDGDVGIGTASPSSPAGVGTFLHIADTAHAGVVLDDTNSTAYEMYSADGHMYFYSESASGNTVIIKDDGKVGIGTTSAYASSTLTLNGNQSALAISRNTGTDPTWTLSSDATRLYLSDDGNTTYNMTWKNDGDVGIGETSPLGRLHIFTGDSTHTGAVDSGANELVIEGSGDTGMSILSPAGNKGGIYFSRAGANTAGSINYHHVNDSPSNSMVFSTASTTALTIDSSQRVGIGTTSPATKLHIKEDSATAGLYIDHNANHAAISIDAENTTSHSVYVESDALTTGNIMRLNSDASSTDVRNLLLVVNANSGATNTALLKLHNASSGANLVLDAYNPYMDFNESGTRRAWIQFHSTGGFLMRNNETQLQYTQLTTHAFTGGNATFSGDVTVSNTDALLNLTSGASNDSVIRFNQDTTQRATIGYDDTNDLLKINNNSNFGGTNHFTIDTSGDAIFSESLTVSKAYPHMINASCDFKGEDDEHYVGFKMSSATTATVATTSDLFNGYTWVAPFNTTLRSIYVTSETAVTSCQLKVEVASTYSVYVNNTATTTTTYTKSFTTGATANVSCGLSISKGNAIRFKINPPSNVDQFLLTFVFE